MFIVVYVLLREHKLVGEIHRCFVLFFLHRKEALEISTMDYFIQTQSCNKKKCQYFLMPISKDGTSLLQKENKSYFIDST